MEDIYSAQGLHVLGFLSNDFANQGGTPEEIDACNASRGITFEQFVVDHVLDPDGAGPQTARPVWHWLTAQPNQAPFGSGAPTWNFHKYLVSREGELVAHWPSAVYPGDDPDNPNDSHETNEIVIAIESELAQ